MAKTLYANTWDSPLSLGGKVAFAPGGQNMKAQSIVTQLQGGEYKRIFPEGMADTKIDLPHEAVEQEVASTFAVDPLPRGPVQEMPSGSTGKREREHGFVFSA